MRPSAVRSETDPPISQILFSLATELNIAVDSPPGTLSAYSGNAVVAYGPFHISGNMMSSAPLDAAARTASRAVAIFKPLSAVTFVWQSAT